MSCRDGKSKTEQTDPEMDCISIVSRRYFLKEALIAVAGGTLAAGCLGGCALFTAESSKANSVSLDPDKARRLPPKALGHIERVSVDESQCASCGMCSLVCAAVHGNASGPLRSGIRVHRKPFECEYVSITCHQCDAPECYFACEEGAFYIDDKTGARAIDSAKCIGCGQCVEACVFDIPRIVLDEDRGRAFKCDLCSGRVQGPACVEFCPRQALKFVRES